MCPQFERKSCESLKKERETVVSQLAEMRKLKTERKKQFLEVLYQLQNISSELCGSMGVNAYLDENNLSLKRLEELRRQLVQFQNEKVIFCFNSYVICCPKPQTVDRQKWILAMCNAAMQPDLYCQCLCRFRPKSGLLFSSKTILVLFP